MKIWCDILLNLFYIRVTAGEGLSARKENKLKTK